MLQIAQPTVSRHLKTLADEGWVEARQDGRHRATTASRPSARRRSARPLAGRARRASGPPGPRGRRRRAARRRPGRSDASGPPSSSLGRRAVGRGFARSCSVRRADSRRSSGCWTPDWTVGDLGAGTGALAGLWRRSSPGSIGVDRSDAMLDGGPASARRASTTWSSATATSRRSRSPTASSTSPSSRSCCTTWWTRPHVLAEVRRALGPGGRVVIVDMRVHERGVGYAEEMGHVWPGFDPDRVAGWLEDGGLRRRPGPTCCPRIRPRADPCCSSPPPFPAERRHPRITILPTSKETCLHDRHRYPSGAHAAVAGADRPAFKVKDLSLAAWGRNEIRLAEQRDARPHGRAQRNTDPSSRSPASRSPAPST